MFRFRACSYFSTNRTMASSTSSDMNVDGCVPSKQYGHAKLHAKVGFIVRLRFAGLKRRDKTLSLWRFTSESSSTSATFRRRSISITSSLSAAELPCPMASSCRYVSSSSSANPLDSGAYRKQRPPCRNIYRYFDKVMNFCVFAFPIRRFPRI